jgi:hypothetical protein
MTQAPTPRSRTGMPVAPLFGLGIVLSVGLSVAGPAPQRSSTTQRSRSLASATGPLHDEAAAIQATLAILPERCAAPAATSSHLLARQMTLKDLITPWYYGEGFVDWDPAWPVWIVAVQCDGVAVNDIVPPPPLPIFLKNANAHASPIAAGAYYVWHTPTGQLLAAGPLEDPATPTSTHTFEELRRILLAPTSFSPRHPPSYTYQSLYAPSLERESHGRHPRPLRL